MTAATLGGESPRRRRRVVGMSGAAVVGFVLAVLTGAAVLAHPLGNFSVNHLDQIRFEPDRIVVDAIVDTAEIPTAQAASEIDADGDGEASGDEFDRYGVDQCGDLVDAFTITVDGTDVDIVTIDTHYEQREGQAGLQTGRLECTFEADVDFGVARSVDFTDDFAPQRVGWREIIATADGVGLVDSPVPTVSVTDGLTAYPVELLDVPSDVRSATFDVVPDDGITTAAESARKVPLSEPGPLSAVVDRVSGRFNDLVGRQELTIGVGSLAVALALLLGSSHALLPGHGKTVMAAYIAGRQGSVRDAVLVGATVTATHTGGVLVLGLALSISSSLAGESVIGWLGVVSGLLIAGLGAALLVGAIRHRPSLLDAHGHHHGPGGHTHGPEEHTHGHRDHGRALSTHEHGHDHEHAVADERGLAGAAVGPAIATIDHDHQHDHRHDDDHPDGHGRHGHADHEHRHDDHDDEHHHHDNHDNHDNHDDHHDHHDHAQRTFSRRGLVGMGVAGGLVPSPSALVILLSAIALGRTAFGIVLVLAYGIGMAGTLTLAGVLLVKLRDRFQERASRASGRAQELAAKWGRFMPYFTAGLVLVVGLGLAIRGLAAV